MTWGSDECFDRREVKIECQMRFGIRISVNKNRLDVLSGEAEPLHQIPDQWLRRLHDGGQSIAFDGHVGKDRLFLEREFSEAAAREFHNSACECAVRLPFASEMQNYIFCST